MLCLLLPVGPLWQGLLCTLRLLPVGCLLLYLLPVKRLRLLLGAVRLTALLITVGGQISQPA